MALLPEASIPEINVAPETLFQVGPFNISNAMFSFYAVMLILFVLAFFIRRKAGVVPSRAQMAFELVMEFMWDKTLTAFESEKRAKKFFPLVLTIFLILIIANQFMLLPFLESIVVTFQGGDTASLFRAPASHYALPIAYTLFVLVLAHVLALLKRPIRHIGNFIKLDAFKIKSIKELPMAFLEFFLGLLDIVGEFAKLASLSTRLFGNVFAGSIIVGIIGGITTYTQLLVPIPFVILGILSGVVQAFVFAMLAILFISSTLNSVSPQEEIAKVT